MATARSDMKGYFKQKKKGGSTISKPSPKLAKKTPPTPYIGVDLVQPPALVADEASLDHQDERDENEEVLRQFDINMKYGPCIGMTRLERWNRANKLGLNPSKEVEELLKSGKVLSECLWDGWRLSAPTIMNHPVAQLSSWLQIVTNIIMRSGMPYGGSYHWPSNREHIILELFLITIFIEVLVNPLPGIRRHAWEELHSINTLPDVLHLLLLERLEQVVSRSMLSPEDISVTGMSSSSPASNSIT
ncbi:hypothetical protein Cgig2_020213 [Carnegiea gigantea]|uniref:DNA polymerase delta subunit 4 n=1 Tax=Carnegiea gigantea TaxID=171969 RepID=A0A9Q1KXE4_9CARY|nr:hypothetical protein Cgig2_020213 [Carnegiea gigantea]